MALYLVSYNISQTSISTSTSIKKKLEAGLKELNAGKVLETQWSIEDRKSHKKIFDLLLNTLTPREKRSIRLLVTKLNPRAIEQHRLLTRRSDLNHF